MLHLDIFGQQWRLIETLFEIKSLKRTVQKTAYAKGAIEESQICK